MNELRRALIEIAIEFGCGPEMSALPVLHCDPSYLELATGTEIGFDLLNEKIGMSPMDVILGLQEHGYEVTISRIHREGRHA